MCTISLLLLGLLLLRGRLPLLPLPLPLPLLLPQFQRGDEALCAAATGQGAAQGTGQGPYLLVPRCTAQVGPHHVFEGGGGQGQGGDALAH